MKFLKVYKSDISYATDILGYVLLQIYQHI